jgi:hypothetical protein
MVLVEEVQMALTLPEVGLERAWSSIALISKESLFVIWQPT